jgi:hypothetical protein
VRRASEPNVALLSTWQELQTEMQLQIADCPSRNVRLLVSNDLAHPVAVGLFRPAVLLPHWFVESAVIEQLRPVLAHEMAHVLHRDALLRWVAAAFQVVFFYQPLFWWLSRELRLCQEYLADAQAAKWAKSAPEYAEQLVSLLKTAPSQPRRPLPAIGILEGRSELYRRIQMLVSTSTKLQPKISRRWSVITAAALLVLAPLLSLVTLQAADTEPHQKPPAVDTEKASSEKAQGAKADAAAKPADEAEENLGEFRYRFVDTKDNPVVGAKVHVWQFAYGSGSSGGPDENLLPSATTDAEGIARLVLAAKGNDKLDQFLRQMLNKGIRSLGLKIDHPDHPQLVEYFNVNMPGPIVLQDAIMIGVRAHREGDKTPLDRLFPAISGNTVDWEQASDMLKIRRVDMASQNRAELLRIVHVPEQGPAAYSGLIDLKEHSGNPIFIDAAIKPGVRVEGRLDEQVPRPVKGGRVVAMIVTGEQRSRWYFSAVTDIAADGTFVFESLPADENLQVIVICDGWISMSPTVQDIQAYQEKHKVEDFANERQGGYMVFPQLVRLAGEVAKPTIAMEATAACEVTVTDEEGKPLPQVTVAFWPNQYLYNAGSTIVGEGSDMLSLVREMLKTGDHAPKISRDYVGKTYSALTDDRGIATIRNLPVGGKDDKAVDRDQSFAVWLEGYAVTAPQQDFGLVGDVRVSQAKNLVPGPTTKASARMHKVAPPPADAPASKGVPDP